MFIVVETFVRIVGEKNVTPDYWPEESKKYVPFLKRMVYCNITNLSKSTNEFSYTVNTDGFGFRIGKPEEEQVREEVRDEVRNEEGAARILVLGDSFVFGNAVDYHESVPYLLERKLNAMMDKNAEVVNLGMGGFSTTEEYLVFKEYGINYKPDLVLVGFYINDFQDSLNFKERQYAKKSAFERIVFKSMLVNWAYWRIKTSHLGNKLTYYFGLNFHTQTAHRFEISLLHNEYLGDPRAKEAIFLTFRSLRDINQLSEQIGAKLVVFYIPAKWQVDPKSYEMMQETYSLQGLELDTDRPQKLLSAFLEKEGISFVDYTDAFRDARPQQLYWKYDWHFNQEGYSLLADIISEDIQQELILSTTQQ